MARRMSCSMTIDAVRSRTKTVTRRSAATWLDLEVGDRLTLIEKGMGLAKGERQVVLAEVEIVNVRCEQLACIGDEDRGTAREGLGHMTVDEFIRFWAAGHGHAKDPRPGLLLCRRIEWRYLDEPVAS